MPKRSSIPILLIVLFSFAFNALSGQNVRTSAPLSFGYPDLMQQADLVKIISPDVTTLLKEDKASEAKVAPYRMGVSLPVYIDCSEDGNWQDIPGGKLWILKIHSQGAIGLGLYFKKFQLPEGCTVHVFDSAAIQVLGAFTHKSNPEGGLYASGITPGSELIIECFRPNSAAFPDIIIDEVLYVYRSTGIPQVNSVKDFGGSGECEVNINCSEGQEWQDIKHGIVRINVKIGGSSFWCSGSLVNNTRIDYTPYILTADHCAHTGGGAQVYASPADLARWIFYFNFESDNCIDPLVQPTLYSSVGAVKIASASSASGSDFYLAMLSHEIPGYYRPFYNGWDRSGVANTGGVCIHHPQGDIKKISTYNSTLTSSEWGTTPGTHWKVNWQATTNGQGVTEGGSSGSPIFDQTGHILGSLTGGDSSCDSLYDPDYFSKFSYSWDKNGTADSTQLRPWLDPENKDWMVLPGSYNNNLVVADFSSDTIAIPVGSTVDFTDRSLGSPTAWAWSFSGAEPATSDKANPQGITYLKLGTYDVQLIASNNISSDTIIRKNYIRVTPAVYPNPSRGIVYILAGKENATGNPVLVHNVMGKLMYKTQWPSDAGHVYSLDLSQFSGNIFFVSFSTRKGITTSKIMLLPKH